MDRPQAYAAMQAGHKITHPYFTDDEFYQMKNGRIIAEDGVDHSSIFWLRDGNDWRAKDWHIIEEPITTNQ